jgi:hypothetical protein
MDSPRPIEAEPLIRVPAGADPLLNEIRSLGFIWRVLVAVILLVCSLALTGCAIAFGQLHHWLAWGAVAFIVEPLALFLALGVVFCLAPDSGIGRWFAWALNRSKWAIWFLLILFAGASIIELTSVVWLWLRR